MNDLMTLLHKISKDFKIFFRETFTIMKTTILIVTNQPNYMELLRLTSLKILRSNKRTNKISPLENEEKDISYDLESLLTNIPVEKSS